MRRMLAAAVAEFRELETARGRLLVLRRRVVPLFAVSALQRHDFTHDSFSFKVASHLGWQAATPVRDCQTDTPQHRVVALRTKTSCKAEAGRSGQATPCFPHYPRNRHFGEVRQASLAL
jgi:hypothetical protein